MNAKVVIQAQIKTKISEVGSKKTADGHPRYFEGIGSSP